MKVFITKLCVLTGYILILFVVPFYAHIDQLYKAPLIFSILIASFLYLSQPLAGEKDSDLSYYVVTYGFIFSLLFPMFDFVYFDKGFKVFYVWGLVISVLGLAYRVYSIKYLGKQFTAKVKIVDEHLLIDSGPYKNIRHPSYTGTLIMLLGNALMYGSWVGLVGIILFMVPAYYYRIRVEEKALGEHFGERYAEYKNRSRALI